MNVYGLGDLGNSYQKAVAAMDAGNVVDLSTVPSTDLLTAMAGLGATDNSKKQIANEISRRQRRGETTNLTDKALFENRSYLLGDARKMLQSRDYQTKEHSFYIAKVATGKTIQMWETGDKTTQGIGNIVQAKLPSEDYFMISSIILQGCSNLASQDEVGLRTAKWGALPDKVLNGEFKFAVENTTYYDKTSLIPFFNQGQRNDLIMGEFKLADPIILYPNRILNFELTFADAITESEMVGLRVELKGMKTRKA